MKIKYTLLLLLVSITSFSQSNYDELITLLPTELNVIESANFYVAEVVDNRFDKMGIGVSQRGIANTKFTTNFESSLTEEVLAFYNAVLPKNESKTPIVVRINELFVYEETKAFSEHGTAYVYLDVFSRTKEHAYTYLGSYSASVKNEKYSVDVTKKHPKRISEALLLCMQKFQKQEKNATIHYISSHPSKISSTREGFELSKVGFYNTYTEMAREIVFPTDGFEMVENTERDFTEKLFIRDSAGQHSNYFSYFNGDHFYLNSKVYTNTEYFVKTYRVGDLLVFNDRMSANVFLGKSNMTTNRKRGVYFFDMKAAYFFKLKKKNMKALLKENYPKLYKEYIRRGEKDIATTVGILKTVFKDKDSDALTAILRN